MSFDFRARLDQYITSSPDMNVDLDNYLEQVAEALSDEFYEVNEDWVAYSQQFTDWCDMCYEKEHNVQAAAGLIQRAHTLYKQ